MLHERIIGSLQIAVNYQTKGRLLPYAATHAFVLIGWSGVKQVGFVGKRYTPSSN